MACTLSQQSADSTGSTSPVTGTFTTVAGDGLIVLLIKTDGPADRAGGAPSIGGCAMVQANSTQKAAASPEAGAELWYLSQSELKSSPLPVGALSFTIPNTGLATLRYMFCSAKAKGGATVQPDVTNGGNATGTNPTPGSVATNEDGDIGFAVVATGAQTWSPSAQAGTALVNADDGAHGHGFQYHQQSSKAAVDLNWTFGTSDDWGAVVAYFKEVPPINFNNLQRLQAGNNVGVTEHWR